MKNKAKTRIVILAAGKGVRMESPYPKVLAKLKDKYLIEHLLESVKKSNIDPRPTIVVGYQKDLVIKELGSAYEYVEQKEQLGTGHAISCAREYLENVAENILVLYGDNPFISAETIKNVIEKQNNSKAPIAFTTSKVENFENWYSAFLRFGRILRKDGSVVGIREYKDATEQEKEIKEVNAGCYVFDAPWLWKNLLKIKNENIQKEYYITDLIDIALKNGEKIETITIDPHEAMGVNSKAELEILEKIS